MNSDYGADPNAHAPVFKTSFLHPRHWGTWFLFGIVYLSHLLPDTWRYSIGGAIGDLFRKLNKKRYSIAAQNIAVCFPELTALEQAQLLKEHYRSYGRGIVDLGVIWWASTKRLDRMTHFNGLENLLNAVERGERVIIFTPHAVGLDFGGIMVSRYVNTIAMMKSLANPLQDWFVSRGRCRFKGAVYLRERGLRPLLRGVRQNRLCFYMPDEDFGDRQSVFVPFFGVPAATLTTLGRMAESTGAVVMPCFSRILADGRGYEVDIDPPMENFPSGDDIEDAKRMNAVLEDGIARAPEQYMWTLRWFKTRPEGEAPVYE